MSKVERSESEAPSGKDSSWAGRSLNTPGARVYSEWVLLVKDLEYALRRAQLWRDLTKSAAGDGGALEVSMSLFRDAVVSLVACFDDTSVVYQSAPLSPIQETVRVLKSAGPRHGKLRSKASPARSLYPHLGSRVVPPQTAERRPRVHPPPP